jgi:hypothetical protein
MLLSKFVYYYAFCTSTGDHRWASPVENIPVISKSEIGYFNPISEKIFQTKISYSDIGLDTIPTIVNSNIGLTQYQSILISDIKYF